MVRLLPWATWIPPLTVRVQPSARIRWTSPETVTRPSMGKVLLTTYQYSFPLSLPPHAVVLLSKKVAVVVPVCSTRALLSHV